MVGGKQCFQLIKTISLQNLHKKANLPTISVTKTI